MNQYYCYSSTNFVAYTLQLTHLTFQMIMFYWASLPTPALINGIRISNYFTGSCTSSSRTSQIMLVMSHSMSDWFRSCILYCSDIRLEWVTYFSICWRNHWCLYVILQHWHSDKRWDDVLITTKATISLSLYRSNWYGWAICMLLSESIKLIQGRGNTGPSWLSCTSVCVLLCSTLAFRQLCWLQNLSGALPRTCIYNVWLQELRHRLRTDRSSPTISGDLLGMFPYICFAPSNFWLAACSKSLINLYVRFTSKHFVPIPATLVI